MNCRLRFSKTIIDGKSPVMLANLFMSSENSDVQGTLNWDKNSETNLPVEMINGTTDFVYIVKSSVL